MKMEISFLELLVALRNIIYYLDNQFMMILLINQDLIVNEFPYLYYASKTIDIDDYIL